MKAVRFWAPNDIRYEEIKIPELAEGEILVKVEAALTCGTDVKTFKRGHPVLIKNIHISCCCGKILNLNH